MSYTEMVQDPNAVPSGERGFVDTFEVWPLDLYQYTCVFLCVTHVSMCDTHSLSLCLSVDR